MAAGPYISNAVAYVVANLHSFVWNKLWTFERRDHAGHRRKEGKQ